MPQSKRTGLLAPATASEHFAAIVESSDDAILSKDPEGIITSWNPAAERMYGYSAEEAVGSHISILIPEHRAGEERQILDRILQGEHVDHYETDRVRKDGRGIRVSLSVSPVRGADGKVEAASVIARDITRQHRSLELASRLQEITTALARESTRERVISVLLSQMVGALGAEAGAVGLVDDDDVVVSETTGYSREGLKGWTRFPVAADLPMSVAIREGYPLWMTTADELVTRFPALAQAEMRFEALAILPLGRWRSALRVRLALLRGEPGLRPRGARLPARRNPAGRVRAQPRTDVRGRACRR